MPGAFDVHDEIRRNWDHPERFLEKVDTNHAKKSTKNGDLPLHTIVSSSKTKASSMNLKKGHLHLVKKLLELHPKGAKHKNRKGQLPIQSAVEVFEAQTLTSSPSEESASASPPALAIELIKCLLNAYPEYLSMEENDDGTLPLRTQWGLEHFTQFLIQNHPSWIQLKDRNGGLPIHDAAFHGDTDAIKLCADAYPKGLKYKDDQFGNLPIHFAVESISALKALIYLDPESVKAQNNDGDLPLHFAAYANDAVAVKTLLDAYPEGATVRNNNGDLPIDDATSEEVVSLLARNDLDSSVDGSASRDRHDNHPVVKYLEHFRGISKKRLDGVKKLLEVSDSVRREDTERISSLCANLNDAQKNLEKEKGLKAKLLKTQVADAERIQMLEAELHSKKDRMHHLESQVRTQQNDIDQAKERESLLAKSLKESRMLEQDYLDKVLKKQENWNLDELKQLLSCLDTRVATIRNVINPEQKPSTNQKLVASMFKLCEMGVEMDRFDALDCIKNSFKEVLGMEDRLRNSTLVGYAVDPSNPNKEVIIGSKRDTRTNKRQREDIETSVMAQKLPRVFKNVSPC